MSDQKQKPSNDGRQRQKALSRWENEGGSRMPGWEAHTTSNDKLPLPFTQKPPMKTIPAHAIAYHKTPVFTNETIPQALLTEHCTSPGIWGLIQVERGMLQYTVKDKEIYTLTPESPGVVEPGVNHFVTPLDAVSFFVEFYREEQN